MDLNIPVLSISMAATTFTGQNIGPESRTESEKEMYIYCDGGWLSGVNRDYIAVDICPQVIGCSFT